MHDERAAAEQRDAAVREAIQVLAEACRSNTPQVVAPLPKVWKPRNVRIGHAEFELDKLAFFILLILVAVYAVAADSQATHWGKAGADVTILTLSNLRPVSGGIRYRW